MKRALPIAVLVLAVTSVPALATHRPGHREPGRITADTTPFTVTFGTATTISGRLTGPNSSGRNVTLAEDPQPYGDGFANVATTTTDANGNYSFRQTPGTSRNYRVTSGNEQAFTGVRVRTRVSFAVSDTTPQRGQRVRFSGFVAPAHNGRTVLIQRRSAAGFWRVVRRVGLLAATGDRSRYRTVLTIRRTGTYRARLLGHGDHLTGTSRTRTLRVP